jgi:hypothetical protein
LKEKSHLQSQIALKERECLELTHKQVVMKSNVIEIIFIISKYFMQY